MKPSSTLYFIYCLVASRWGKSVKIKRDSLHSRYKVNQYGVKLSGVSPHQMLYHLSHEFWNAGYDEERPNMFTRVVGKTKTYIHFSTQQDSLDVVVFAYKIDPKG